MTEWHPMTNYYPDMKVQLIDGIYHSNNDDGKPITDGFCVICSATTFSESGGVPLCNGLCAKQFFELHCMKSKINNKQ